MLTFTQSVSNSVPQLPHPSQPLACPMSEYFQCNFKQINRRNVLIASIPSNPMMLLKQ
jgi:hypothetical protein